MIANITNDLSPASLKAIAYGAITGIVAERQFCQECRIDLTQSPFEELSNDFIVLQSRSWEEEGEGRCGASLKTDDEA